MEYRFVDCRWALDDPGFGRRAYLEAHIPGAAFLDVERDLAAAAGAEGRHPLPSAEQFAAAASRAGIGADTLWSRTGPRRGRAAVVAAPPFRPWRLRRLRPRAWHGPLVGGDEQIEPAIFEAVPQEDDTISRDELARQREQLVVVDARLEPRWRGEPNPVDRVPGRIPGALNAPWAAPLPELPAGELVAYCGSGITACVVLHRLHLAGREGRLYPGSWSEWEQYPELPVERST